MKEDFKERDAENNDSILCTNCNKLTQGEYAMENLKLCENCNPEKKKVATSDQQNLMDLENEKEETKNINKRKTVEQDLPLSIEEDKNKKRKKEEEKDEIKTEKTKEQLLGKLN